MDHQARIEQWEKMTREAPDDMAWFSLGSAYKDAGRFEDADRAFASALELNPGMSRAYQLQAQVLIQLNKTDRAAQVLLRGYTIAAERGDVMPQRAMGALLEKIGRPVPLVKAAAPKESEPITGDAVVDRKTGERGNRLPDPPMRGPLGLFIYDHYNRETWKQWIGQGTKVINELRLDFSNDAHQKTYEDNMLEWLGFTREEAEEYAKSKKG
ncbi:MAG: Fe(2+)-trafficking protein [Planctomycetes bacterium]|nr:Fe(2+)-trafficking protein [Planctomycetota bacterium]